MRSKLNKADEKYLLENREQPMELLAKDLDLSLKSIEKFFSDNPIQKKETLASKNLVRNEKYGVVAMSEATSQMADDGKKAAVEKADKHIFRR